jgi:hypothetical protein
LDERRKKIDTILSGGSEAKSGAKKISAVKKK